MIADTEDVGRGQVIHSLFQATKEGFLLLLVWFLFWFGFLFFRFLGLHPRHVEVPRLGVESELQLLAYTTATATLDLSCVFYLPHSSRQHHIFNPLSKARD